jgi:hypothetical protein
MIGPWRKAAMKDQPHEESGDFSGKLQFREENPAYNRVVQEPQFLNNNRLKRLAS